ncbi:MAG: aminotransferase class I/II-fold pyridoxal phosphate-dependent enzyme, partial [Firmicutes bacterium]|nr:aminotransferase class I/II-fold pyridoxal phosphate-dependent enzyme [Bacillota bacterium]
MSNLDFTKTGFSTAAVHAGYIRDKEWGAEATPIYQTSTYTFETLEEGGGVFSGTVPKYPYARTANPTVATFERKMCALEHANAAVATGSGMGAVSSALLGVLSAGDHIVSSDTVYGCTDVVMRSILPSLGFETTQVDTSNPEAVKAAIRPNTKILYFEVAANPTMKITDIEEMVKIGHEAGALVIVDNTFTPPPVCRPLDFGVDIVLHSVTKYLNGHGDVIAGVICSKDEELIHTIKSKAVGKLTGSAMAPMMAFLIVRGLKTLGL